jgi:hypothetical protein
LRPRGDADAVRLSDREGQPDANPDPNAVADSVVIRQSIGDRNRQRVADAMSIALCDCVTIAFCDGVRIAERQREAFVLALGPLPQSLESVQE